MRADAEGLRQRVGGQHRRQWETAAQRFCGSENIGRYAVVHIGVERAGTADAALHFIENQQRVMGIAQLAQPAQEGGIRRHHAAFALNRLHNHRAGVVVNQRGGRVEIVIGGVFNARRKRCEIFRVGRLSSRRHGEQRATVKRVFKRHDAAFLLPGAVMRIFTRQFQRRFVRFRSGVTEEHAIGESGINQLLRQLQNRLIGVAVSRMPEARGLLLQGELQFRCA